MSFFSLVLLSGMMDSKAKCHSYNNKFQDQTSRNKHKRTQKQAICQTGFGVQGSVKKQGENRSLANSHRNSWEAIMGAVL